MEPRALDPTTLSVLALKYKRINDLLNVELREDSDKSILTKKYSAATLLNDLKTMITGISKQNLIENDVNRLKAMLAVIHLHFGDISRIAEYNATGVQHLHQCLEIIKHNEMLPEIILIAVQAFLKLKMVHSDIHEQIAYLCKAERFCDDYFLANRDHFTAPISILNLFGIYEDIDTMELLRQHQIKIALLLTSLYTKQHAKMKSVLSFHGGLKTIISFIDTLNIHAVMRAGFFHNYFTENCDSDSSFLIHNKNAALWILEYYGTELEIIYTMGCFTQAKEKRFRYILEWISHGISLFCVTTHRLPHIIPQSQCGLCAYLKQIKIDKAYVVAMIIMEASLDMSHFLPENTNMSSSKSMRKLSHDYPDIWTVFLNLQQWLRIAKMQCNFKRPSCDYIAIILSFTQIMAALTIFEENNENKITIHKERIECFLHLEEIDYPEEVLIYRTVWRELGFTYNQMLEILVISNASMNLIPEPILSKINQYGMQAIDYYERYLNTYIDIETQKMPETFPDNNVAYILKVYYYLGKLHLTLSKLNKNQDHENKWKSSEAYKRLLDYCAKVPDVVKLIKDEIPLRELSDIAEASTSS
ncbi:protein KBP homolog [Cephus cinctus]|uniref:KIF-binding protein n=1 Tax=Cephus cinctus TaxID=211228 RepID=A0AAJ7C3Y9_CEPCN|nr:protein KBP homolog [Cephus cinctus]XP_015601375.1 protein KBP homolog [Cephus cinctus]